MTSGAALVQQRATRDGMEKAYRGRGLLQPCLRLSQAAGSAGGAPQHLGQQCGCNWGARRVVAANCNVAPLGVAMVKGSVAGSA
jgi:hypothetical protein